MYQLILMVSPVDKFSTNFVIARVRSSCKIHDVPGCDATATLRVMTARVRESYWKSGFAGAANYV